LCSESRKWEHLSGNSGKKPETHWGRKQNRLEGKSDAVDEREKKWRKERTGLVGLPYGEVRKWGLGGRTVWYTRTARTKKKRYAEQKRRKKNKGVKDEGYSRMQ